MSDSDGGAAKVRFRSVPKGKVHAFTGVLNYQTSALCKIHVGVMDPPSNGPATCKHCIRILAARTQEGGEG